MALRELTTRFTLEDHDVVATLVLHRRGGFSWLCQLMAQSYEQDRRDAAIMLQLQIARKEFGQAAVALQQWRHNYGLRLPALLAAP